jgi:hypothetical protein
MIPNYLTIKAGNTVSVTASPTTTESIPIQLPAAVPLTPFCKLIKMEQVMPGQTANVAVLSAIQATIENPTTYESSGDTIAAVQPTQVHLHQPFGLDAPSQNAGLNLSMQFESAVATLSASSQAKVLALFTAANSGDADSEPATTFAKGNMQTLLASVKNITMIGLETAYHAKAEPTWFPPGTEKLLHECSDFTGAEAGTVGFVAGANAIALPYGFPMVGARPEIKTEIITLPNGLPCQFTQWFSMGGRSWRGSLDVVIAPAIGQSGALRLLKNA